MKTYVLRRLLAMVPVLFGVSLIAFALMRVMPGDVAVAILVGDGEGQPDAATLEALREQLGLNEPLPVQYFEWVGGLLTGDAGVSLWSGRPVFEEIGSRVGLTVQLSLLSFAISLAIGIPLGIISAVRQNKLIDYVVRVVSIGGLAMPVFWLAFIVVLILTNTVGYAPPLGYVDVFEDPWTNFQQLIWPALILGYSHAAVLARMTRSAMLDVLGDDYLRTARAKGLGTGTILVRHALRNGILPVVTLAGTQLGGLLEGTVLMETIFTLPGTGRLLVDSITARDYPVVQTMIVLIGAMFVVLNLVVDVLYAYLDPRMQRVGGK